MTAVVYDTWWMTRRRLAVFLAQPGYLVVTLIQPVIWLFLFGSLFGRVVELPGFGANSYLDYLVPGGAGDERVWRATCGPAWALSRRSNGAPSTASSPCRSAGAPS